MFYRSTNIRKCNLNKALVHGFFALLLFANCSQALAQVFTDSTAAPIPHNHIEACYPIQVSGLPSKIDSGFGLTSVCLNLRHVYDGSVEIKLVSPDSTIVYLSYRNGDYFSNYTATCFSQRGKNGFVRGAKAPFTGEYIPDQSLNGFNNGQDPNGTWSLCITDIYTHVATPSKGTYLNCTLTFGANPPKDSLLPNLPCSFINPAACKCPNGDLECDLLPDMTASYKSINTEHTEYAGYITLSNATPNIGWGPMEINPVDSCFCDTVQVSCTLDQCPDGSYPKQKINQRIYHLKNGVFSYYDKPAGRMGYHPAHQHIHVDDWAEFSVRQYVPNMSPLFWPIVGESSKMTYCLTNLGDCDNNKGYCLDTLGGIIKLSDLPNANLGSVSGCGTSQGIFVGNIDEYQQVLPGMRIDLPNVCNGNYYIVSVTDPLDHFKEWDEKNNYTVVPITLNMQMAKPVADFNFLVNGLEVSFSNTPSITNAFEWSFGDSAISTNQNPVHVYASPGNYLVQQIITNACGSDTITKSILVTGMEDQVHVEKFVRVYPNPSSGILNISLFENVSNEHANYKVQLYDASGKNIWFKNTESSEKNMIINLNNLQLVDGVYYLSVSNSSFIIHKKVVVVHDAEK